MSLHSDLRVLKSRSLRFESGEGKGTKIGISSFDWEKRVTEQNKERTSGNKGRPGERDEYMLRLCFG